MKQSKFAEDQLVTEQLSTVVRSEDVLARSASPSVDDVAVAPCRPVPGSVARLRILRQRQPRHYAPPFYLVWRRPQLPYQPRLSALTATLYNYPVVRDPEGL